MCGITGAFQPTGISSTTSAEVRSALNELRHRGPDNHSFFDSPNCCLGHARLSIIEPSAASHQPFYSKDKRYVIVFNGEVFNFRELRQSLQNRGIGFKTDSDTEVVLYGMILEGTNFLNKINGFFAFAFYDQHSNEILLVRDRFGEKPLYWSNSQNGLFFASELGALTKYSFKKTIDKSSLWLYFRLSYIPAPRSIFTEIKKLEPGHFIRSTTNGITSEKWYNPESKNLLNNKAEAREKLAVLLENAVQRRLIADRPIGAFLSGGIDSTIVCGIAAKHMDQLNTFSISFPEYPYFDERKYAENAAKHSGTNHTTIPIGKTELANAIDPVLNQLSEPFADSSSVPMFVLSREVGQHIRVALSGDGADELFGGYNKHRALLRSLSGSAENSMAGFAQYFIPSALTSRNGKWKDRLRLIKKYGKGLQLNARNRYFEWSAFSDDSLVGQLFTPEYSEAKKELLIQHCAGAITHGTMEEFLLNDQALVLTNDMLYKVDQMSMAHALEVRSPFLDHEIVEFAQQIPAEWKLNAKQGKLILRETFNGYLPESILNRSKRGFEVPLEEWISIDLQIRIKEEWLSADYIKKQGIFNLTTIQNILREPQLNAHLIWMLVVFQSWYRRNCE
ncbi:MAG: asparagine synthase (glutamine-hydrolyzing) [Flavobacteriales bacterium]